MSKILVFAESKDNVFKANAFEVVSAGKYLADKLGSEFAVITINDAGDDQIKALGMYGAAKVYQLSLNELNAKSGIADIKYSHGAFASAVSSFADANGYDIVLLSGTSFGREISPSIAAKTGAAIVPDVVDFIPEDGGVCFKRPAYAGKCYTKVKANGGKVVVTLRPNVLKSVENNTDAAVEKITPDSVNIGANDFSAYVSEVAVASGKLDVAEADIIVSGGRGMRGPENFHLVEELAGVLGAAVGASRAVVDAGWRPHGEQVGQTGKTVSPSLYVACGISGAIQHLAGMSSSKYIVAINKDKDAPIFQVADYGIVGDVFEVLPAMTEEIKKLKG
ncbi:MAG: electron transfer flavoprotein subunit alpha/FixB family protein [Ignavibacteriota bacterium]